MKEFLMIMLILLLIGLVISLLLFTSKTENNKSINFMKMDFNKHLRSEIIVSVMCMDSTDNSYLDLFMFMIDGEIVGNIRLDFKTGEINVLGLEGIQEFVDIAVGK